MKESNQKFSVAVFGLGYVGCVTAACLAHDGHSVTGIDVSEVKMQAIAEGYSPLKEPGLDEIIYQGVQQKKLKVSQDVSDTIFNTAISIICVDTPNTPTDGINLEYIRRVCEQIGTALRNNDSGHVVVLRSTVLPGTMKNLVIPTLEKHSGKKAGDGFFVAFNPEFMREGSAIQDYLHPPVIIIGSEWSRANEILKKLYNNIEAPVITTTPEVAEMVKYVNNAWHALKITFANEIGEICRHCNIDSHAVMDICLQDRQLNILPAYLQPGFACGGSCLPKDLRAIMHFARHHDIDVPVLHQIMASNPEFIQIGKLTGANRAYIDQHLPHLAELLVDSFYAFEDFAELVVIGHKSQAAAEWVKKRPQHMQLLDLARLDGMDGIFNYEGIYW